MKLRIIFTLVLIASIAIPSYTQEVTNTFFIFCKDQKVMPFLFEAVKAMRQTETLVEGELTQVTEVVTTDSIYTIPVASIDSISFVTPKTVRKPNSHELPDELLSYLTACDSLSLYFSKQTPENLLPEIGYNVTRSTPTELLPYGFLGKVKNIQTEESGIIINCDSIGMGDAFTRFYQPGGFITDPAKSFGITSGKDTRSEYNAPKWDNFHMEPKRGRLFLPSNFYPEISYDLPADFSFGIDGDVVLHFTLEPQGQYMIFYEDGAIFPNITLSFKPRVVLETDWNTNLSLSWDIDEFLSNFIELDIVDVAIPIPYSCGLVRFEVRPDFELSGEVAIDIKRTDEMFMDYFIHWSRNPNFKNTLKLNSIRYSELSNVTAMFNGSIDFFMGVYAGVYFGVKGWSIPTKKDRLVSVGVRAGYDINWSWKVGLEDFSLAKSSTALYDHWRQQYVAETKFIIEPQLAVKVNENVNASYSYAFEWPYKPLDSKTIFPAFNNMKLSETSHPNLNYSMSDDLFFSVIPGIKVFDKENNLIFSEYSNKLYKNSDDPNFFSFPYENTLINRTLTVYPAFKLFNREILASPALSLYLEAQPLTSGAMPDYNTAELFGELRLADNAATNDKLNWMDSEVGFMIGTSAEGLKENGRMITCTIDENRCFSATVESLIPETTYYYCAFISNNEETLYGEIESFITERTEEVDLGLSVNWRAWNLGADIPSRRGNLYAWGEVEPKSHYDWSTYFDNPYDNNNSWIGCSIDTDISNSYLDPTTLLEKGWRMPTRDEMQELVELCQWVWTTEWSVNGYRVTGPSGNSIFLPATGLGDKDTINSPDQYGAYWTSTPQTGTDGKATAATLYFYGEHLKSLQWANRYNGRAIRPVKDKL